MSHSLVSGVEFCDLNGHVIDVDTDGDFFDVRERIAANRKVRPEQVALLIGTKKLGHGELSVQVHKCNSQVTVMIVEHCTEPFRPEPATSVSVTVFHVIFRCRLPITIAMLLTMSSFSTWALLVFHQNPQSYGWLLMSISQGLLFTLTLKPHGFLEDCTCPIVSILVTLDLVGVFTASPYKMRAYVVFAVHAMELLLAAMSMLAYIVGNWAGH